MAYPISGDEDASDRQRRRPTDVDADEERHAEEPDQEPSGLPMVETVLVATHPRHERSDEWDRRDEQSSQ